MKIKIGTQLFKCTAPVEQKVYASGLAAGWVCMFTITELVTSQSIDELFTTANLSTLVFFEDDGTTELFRLVGYCKINSVMIHHASPSNVEDPNLERADIQLSKGC